MKHKIYRNNLLYIYAFAWVIRSCDDMNIPWEMKYEKLVKDIIRCNNNF